MKRKQWFIDRVGKRIFRNYHKCCEHCDKIYADGIVISDITHANYLYDIECEFRSEGINIYYFGTRKEVEDYEQRMEDNK